MVRHFQVGDRVRVVDPTTSEVGTVVALGAVLGSDFERVECVRVLWPVGSEPRTQGWDGRLHRWHEADGIELFTPADDRGGAS